MMQTQWNAGPHSFVGLLFSFQRPSFAPRTEKSVLESSPDRRGVAKTTVLRQGVGRRTYHRRPATVKRKARDQRLERPPDVRESTSTSTPQIRQVRPGDPSVLRRSEPEGCCFYSLAGPSSRTARNFADFHPGALPGEGASFIRRPRRCQAFRSASSPGLPTPPDAAKKQR